MSKFIIFVCLGLLVVVFPGCTMTGKCDCIDKGLQNIQQTDSLKPKIIGIEHLREAFTIHGIYSNFGYQFFNHRGQLTCAFLNATKDSIIFVSLPESGKTVAVPTLGFIKKKTLYSVLISEDTIHLVDADRFIYHQISIGDSFLLKEVKTSLLSAYLSPKKYYFNTNTAIDKKMAYHYPYIIIPYGKIKKNQFSIDNKAALIIDLVSKQSNKAIDYPGKYKECFISLPYPLVTTSGNSVASVFLKSDKIQVTDLATGEKIRENDSTYFPNNFMCPDLAAMENLAYSDKYQLADEENRNLVYSNGHYYIIKRIRKPNKDAANRCAILVFDEHLSYVRSYFPAESFSPRMAFPYAGGIAFINEKWDKLIIYEI